MNTLQRPHRLLVLLLATVVGVAPALAAPPSWAGGGGSGGKHGAAADDDRPPQQHKPKKAMDDRADTHMHSDNVGKGSHVARKPLAPGAYFDDRNRVAVQKYYSAHPGKACPPGLAKKHNGCLPPGQAKKWQVGQPLPADVVYTTVPQPVLVLLPAQPPGYRYVQVAGDILLIAVGTKMVVDGINGLSR